MTEFSDVRGLPVTASDPDAVAALDTAIEGYLSMAEDVLDAARAATAADPGMPMGHILVGCLFMLGGREGFLPKADRAIAKAQALGGNARERAHLEALRHWREGRLERANAVWDDILLDRPRDILAFRLAHYLHFYVGALERMRDSAARILPAWDEGVPGYGYVLGCRGFALEEIGSYAEAEPHRPTRGRHAAARHLVRTRRRPCPRDAGAGGGGRRLGRRARGRLGHAERLPPPFVVAPVALPA